MTTTYKFKCGYTKLGVLSAPSVAPTLKIVTVADVVLANGVAVTALANLPGVYIYSYSGADGLDLIGVFHTTDATVDQQDLASYTPEPVIENGVSLIPALRLMLASLAGELSGAGTTVVKIRDVNDTKDRITATVDADGNRTAVVKDAS